MKPGPKGSHLQLVDATKAADDCAATDDATDDATCGGRTRAGGECKKPPGQGTDHVGVGQCRHHDGQVDEGAPCPLPLTKLELRLWDEFSGQLAALGLLKRAYWAHIYGLVVAVAGLHSARQAGMMGQTVKGDNGTFKKHPSATVVNQMLSQIRNYSNDLGLNPSALVAMDLPDPDRKPSAMEGYIKGRK